MGRLWGLHIKEECPAVPDLAHTVARSLLYVGQLPYSIAARTVSPIVTSTVCSAAMT